MSAERGAALAERFAARFGRRAEVLARAPGRVNLIGEHTDYNGLPVLPLAIDRAVWVAGAARDDRRVRVASDAPRFAPRTYHFATPLPPFPAGDWGNYHKAAAQGLLAAPGGETLRGGDFLVDGDVPAGAGLSSSSALVVGSLLALLAVNERAMPAAVLAELAATAERYVGTHSGGMDQAVCLLARAGHALRIDFQPLRTRAVPLPAGAAIVVCDSLVAAEKSGAARDAYNQRVAECGRACRALEVLLRDALSGPLENLGALQRLFAPRPLHEFAALLEAAHADPVAVRRARHVCREAERVDAAEAALQRGDLPALGALMDASHRSCRDDYDISAPALEALVAAAKDAGALGARLTGAGFGGCTVNLVSAAEVDAFLERIERGFYAGRPVAGDRAHAFAVVASAGATVARL